MNIAILGLGYVGTTAAACLAKQGHSVVGVDANATKVAQILSGKSPIVEPQLDDLIADAVSAGRLTAFTNIGPEVADCKLAIVCVGTPSAPDGSHNMGYIAEITRQIAELMRAQPEVRLAVAYRSTFRPGTIESLIIPIFEDVLGRDVDRVELIYNPEFLRESVAVKDFFAPPKIVIGTADGRPSAVMDEMNIGIDAQTFYVKFREAEFTKFFDNTFHALKAAFANEIGRVCVKLGVSPAAVHEIFVSDTKLNISKNYLRPGGAFGGSCLPKDVRALQHMSRQINGRTPVIDALVASNDEHKQFLYDLSVEGLDHGAKVLLLGIAFKDKSDDLRESPNIDLARNLITAGYDLSIYDPYVDTSKLIGQNLGAMSNSPFLRTLLKSREEIEANDYDLVLDTRGTAGALNLRSARTVDISALK